MDLCRREEKPGARGHTKIKRRVSGCRGTPKNAEMQAPAPTAERIPSRNSACVRRGSHLVVFPQYYGQRAMSGCHRITPAPEPPLPTPREKGPEDTSQGGARLQPARSREGKKAENSSREVGRRSPSAGVPWAMRRTTVVIPHKITMRKRMAVSATPTRPWSNAVFTMINLSRRDQRVESQ